jgi:hypothetical protein
MTFLFLERLTEEFVVPEEQLAARGHGAEIGGPPPQSQDTDTSDIFFKVFSA